MPGTETIVVSGVVVRDDTGRLLTVRKRGTTRFMLPGGKPEPDESAVDAAARECLEEIGLTVAAGDLDEWGAFRSAAANEDGFDVLATIFDGGVVGSDITPSAEIAEIRWLDIDTVALPEDLAPLLVDHVIPMVRASIRRD
ncbi:NUDIX domain-containing protein [Gordonia sp. ABSL11-1]|uniref:NUDIX hydrolase n=1 Tax=Gordonia sp. ABSL11-1 TaxID=3053924 RepID=UPI002572B3E9|nr:NUDIX domain-containing protein [Gordonia sp. ABSL11-1]MDL9947261.1 NUDIX domain-containing protein [Gordonia sp. ABSL11-1]